MRRLITVGVVTATALLAAACGSSASSSSSTGSTGGTGTPTGTLTISNESGSTWTCGFSPFNSSVNFLSLGAVYEPLVFVNSLKSGQTTPWLASSWAWSNGNKTITFTIRKGVKFNDGSPMTAADVLFTFNLLKKFPALDLNSVWAVLSSVTQSGDTVVMNFKTAAVPYFYFIADQIGIVPAAIWSKIANPVTYQDANPVGTGAFTVNCNPQLITYTASTHYYVPGEPHIAKVLYPAYTSNNAANLDLATGKDQWGGQFIPSINQFYKNKSSGYQYWFPPTANVDIFPNLKDPIMSQLPVRQAMALGIDRSKVSAIGEYGYEPPANQSGIVTPTFSSWLDTSQAAAYGNSYNPTKAIKILTAAGWKKGSDGIMAKGGQKLDLSIINVGDFSDWVQSVQLISQELMQIGIKLTPVNLSSTDLDQRLFFGHYQLAYNTESGGPSPYYELRQLLYGPNSAPVGKQASTNWERYSNPATDTLFNQYGATISPTMQQSIVNQLQQVMLTQVPVIPITEAVNWYQYDTSKFTGWATPSNPFALPAPYATPDMGIMLLHLAPKA
jgi:peptide/nickel transport system substrate-binding protein